MENLIEAFWGITISIGVSALIFVGANRLFDLVVDRWFLFRAITGAICGAIFSAVLVGNRLVKGPSLLFIIVCALIFLALASIPSLISIRKYRVGAGLTMGAGVGLIITTFLKDLVNPEIQFTSLLVLVVAAALIYSFIAFTFRNFRIGGFLFFVMIGWVLGGWLLAEIGEGTKSSAYLLTVITFSLLGASLTSGPERDLLGLNRFQEKTRVAAFLGPALLFVSLGLIIPLARTVYLSLHGIRGREWAGLKNYGEILTNKSSVDLSDWSNIFTSRLFVLALVLIFVGTIAGLLSGRKQGRILEPNGSFLTPSAIGAFLFIFAVFSTLRGTVINNLWWVIVVTLLSTGIGLLAAVLADRARFESAAKSLIFLPMAISFVGAGIIWKFMYIARPPKKPQTGLFNAIWVGLGKLNSGNAGQIIGVAILVAVTAGLVALSIFGVRRKQIGISLGSLFVSLPILWILYRLLGPGIGGVEEGPLGLPIGKPILFVQESPFNNVWLMVVLIWIQTGFAMVILSAAIKAVPTDLIEAARVDGANDRQVFFNVTLPTITPTISVIVTALIVLVMKVFDIVRVMTNGNFGTQVIANEMWQKTFTEFNLGLGSALATVLFLAVVPAMALNVRRMQRGAIQ